MRNCCPRGWLCRREEYRMEKPQYIDWLVEESGVVIKDYIPLKCYKIDYKCDESILDDVIIN